MKLAEKAMKKDELFGEFRRYAVLKDNKRRIRTPWTWTHSTGEDVTAKGVQGGHKSTTGHGYKLARDQDRMRNGVERRNGRKWNGARLKRFAKGTEGIHGRNAIVVGNGGIQRQLPIAGQGIQWDVLELWDSTALGQALPESKEDQRQGQGEGEERKRELEK